MDLIENFNDDIDILQEILDDSSSSSDEDMELATAISLENQILSEKMEYYSELDFLKMYRIDIHTFETLLRSFENSDFYRRGLFGDLSASKVVRIFLYFSGSTHSSCTELADTIGINTADLIILINEVSKFICSSYSGYIKWPDVKEAIKSRSYYNSKGFSNVIGCLGYLNIPIEDKKSWESNTNYQFVIQAVCNENHAFVHIFISENSVTEPTEIFGRSSLADKFKDFPFSKYGFLLVTTNPNLRNKFLLSPHSEEEILKPKERIFNDMLTNCNKDIEDTFKSLLKRFKQLLNVQLKNSSQISNFIKACCILHNFADKNDLHLL